MCQIESAPPWNLKRTSSPAKDARLASLDSNAVDVTVYVEPEVVQ